VIGAFRIIQNAISQCFVGGQKLLNIVLKLNFWVDSGPVVGCPNESQEKQQVLKSHRTQQSLERVDANRPIRGLQEDMAREREYCIFNLRVGGGYFRKRCGARRAKRKAQPHFRTTWKWTSQQINDIRDTLSASTFVTSWTTTSNQETHMTSDAIADSAKT